jgi:hypothetical protein
MIYDSGEQNAKIIGPKVDKIGFNLAKKHPVFWLWTTPLEALIIGR